MDFTQSYNVQKVLELLPYGVLTMDSRLIIVQINRAARRLLGFGETAELTGSPLGRVMDETPFLSLRDGARSRFSDTVLVSDGTVCLERSISCDEERALFVCTLRDVTQLKQQQERELQSRQEAAQLAEAINEKQLRIVHDIAGLLGENAVETQQAIFELRQKLLGKENKHV